MAEITVNGETRRADVEGDTPLLWVLRDTLGLVGTKYGCGVAQCGACTVLVDGVATRSCQLPLDALAGRPVTTIEAIEADPIGARLVAAWVALDVPQCGYCQSGQLMAATALLKETPKPDDAAIAAAMTNLCRCGTYNAIAAGIRRAAEAA
ncbi:(2Fe-2S)-binding protein [Falsiroseomonas ponticola]|jgi:isoquinoline 1-oxidoreductase alpha subunit|uniref:(2Fe-2S)-binding protein n=1 Tax=Falsiroseomonas ponticola TaxID=2786951 RepID=UPI0019339EAB|nr:(2Fe-2S)-binding protein [Roseomonas ponticola]